MCIISLSPAYPLKDSSFSCTNSVVILLMILLWLPFSYGIKCKIFGVAPRPVMICSPASFLCLIVLLSFSEEWCRIFWCLCAFMLAASVAWNAFSLVAWQALVLSRSGPRIQSLKPFLTLMSLSRFRCSFKSKRFYYSCHSYIYGMSILDLTTLCSNCFYTSPH